MAYNEILEIKPINEEIWVVYLNKNKDTGDQYSCQRVIGIAKYREMERGYTTRDSSNAWSFCTFDESTGVIEVSDDVSGQIGILYGSPTKERIKRCIDNKDNCEANVGGFVSGFVDDLED